MSHSKIWKLEVSLTYLTALENALPTAQRHMAEHFRSEGMGLFSTPLTSSSKLIVAVTVSNVRDQS